MRWHKTLADWLTDKKGQGFIQGQNDPCIFTHPVTGLRVVVVVDDILCRGPMQATQQFYKDLESKFDVKEPNFLTTNDPITYMWD